ncbi:hypothetical protein JCM10213_002212 [Rhodosporidiobolus nylandii]
MAPASAKSKAYSNPATQADDAKYASKYKELKVKVQEVEEDNTKLSVQILKSKKAIQRLRIERAILYDRLQSTVAPTNPYSLSSAAHFASLASSSDPSSSSAAPPSILAPPNYPLADPAAPELFLKQLDAQKLAALQRGNGATTSSYGQQPFAGVAGEAQAAQDHRASVGETANGAANGQHAAGPFAAPAAPPAAVPQAVSVPHQSYAMQVDQP